MTHLLFSIFKMKINNRAYSLLLLLYFSIGSAFAVSAYPYKVMVKTDNGKEVAIFLRGDENNKYAVTSDGFTILCDEKGWWYAEKDSNGNVVKSSFKLMSIDDETEHLKKFKLNCSKGLVPDISATTRRVAAEPRRANTTDAIVGERRALVILMQYKDVRFKTERKDFVSLFNSVDYHENDVTGSVRDYYRFASQGQLDYVSDIYGPYTSENNMNYYGANVSTGGSDAHALDLCIEAMKSLPDTVDFSRYDNDEDGLIDNVHIIYAGYGEEAGGAANAIWAHEYPHRINLKNDIGYSLSGYSCSPELRGNYGSDISHIGVVCHELGHALGAMDYYDTNYGTGGEYAGTGKWDIMAGGSWNDNGKTPPNFNPFVRSVIFGWNKQETLTSDQQITMPRMETNNPELTPVYKMETGSSGDYFLLENRQRHGFDAKLPGEGLMIYHVHPNIERYRSTNTINASHPQAMYPVCASGSTPSARNYGDINSSGCPFPGTRNISSFSADTAPAAVAWNGSAAKVSISNIAIQGADGTVSFVTSGNSGEPEPIDPDQPIEKDLKYFEGFEDKVENRMTILSVIGKNSWCTYRTGDIGINTEYIPSPTNGESLLMLFSGKDNATSESEIASKPIAVESGENYTIAFDICTKTLATAPPPSFRLYVEDQYGEYRIYSTDMLINDWENVEVPVVFADNEFKYKMYGRINTGGIFVDNFRLFKEESTSIANALQHNQPIRQGKVYTLHGVCLGDFGDVKSSLKRGVYIIRQNEQSTIFVMK